MNRQGNLNKFLDMGRGLHAPRKRHVYASKQLQQVVSDFCKWQTQLVGKLGSTPELEDDENQYQETDEPAKKKKKAE